MNPFQQQGAFSWCELMTSDIGAAKDFYQQLFGWTWKDREMEGGKTYITIKAGEQPVGGILSTENALSEEAPPPHWGMYVTVENVDQTLELAQSMGAKVFVPPTDIPDTGRFAVFADPQGAVLSIISYN
ncbi:Glyoxalase family protein [Hyella patelloides LEGE 07179]|uniref:Glyoxalase family protein n=1 Tax=Hyella patelloides LEGE 07179 TaxID=945734 RepID=A0A563VYK7_9CYAN|nr:VOC family protein [Hyella patelloides]VEP16542.1 Glyoxalase family protein [Hyella patelloides LEGE 07179]